MRRTVRARRWARNRRRWRNARFWSAGPHSYLDRLRVAAFDGHRCRPYVVMLEREEEGR